MKIAFTMFKYFPYGGLQRDALRIAELCLNAGAKIDIYAARLDGDPPQTLPGITFIHLPGNGISHHRQYLSFAKQIGERVEKVAYEAVVGFNKMPGLDLYFAADPCYAETVKRKSFVYRLTSRYRIFSAFEKAIFTPPAATVILSISEVQRAFFQASYNTPSERFCDLPPGVPADRLLPSDCTGLRDSLRREFNLAADEQVVLMVGSGFKRKGVDRALQAFAALPESLLLRSRLLVVGDDDLDSYRKTAQRLKLADRVIFTGGRTDIQNFLAAADLFLHPARQENTGGVLIEALAASLPVLVTAVCGYSVHIARADAGSLVAEPFHQEELNRKLQLMLDSSDQRELWRENARKYVANTDLFSLAERAAEMIMKVAGKKYEVSS